MKHIIFTVYDVAAKAFIPPFFLPNKEMAIRTFKDCINSDNHQFAVHPEDYTLYAVGSFDDETSLITAYAERDKLGNGLDYVTIITDREQDKLLEAVK